MAMVAGCGGGQSPQATVTAACGGDVDPPPPRNAPLPARDAKLLGGGRLRIFNPLTISVDIFWATRDQVYPFPIDRLRTEGLNLGRGLPGTTVLEVPPGLPPGTFYKLRSEPVAGRQGAPIWTLTPAAWRQVRLQMVCAE
jgi:hypothetical protein